MNELFYGEFYGLDAAPFNTTPDSSLLFATETHQQALATIEYGISSGKGFIVITGEVGVGKTTVLRTTLDRLDADKAQVIYIFNPDLTPANLYETLLDELDTPPSDLRNASNPLHRLHRALLRAHAAGRQVILAIDEAQNMPETTLEALRMLTNFATKHSNLLQIVLVGQPELEVVLAKHSMRQLTQRIAVRARIRSLSWRQSCRYIKHRLQCAGRAATMPLFTLPALGYVALRSKGIPRSINIACDNALISGYGAAAKRISFKLAYESCRSLGPEPRSGRIAALATVALVAAMIMAVGVFRGGSVDSRRNSEDASWPPPTPASASVRSAPELAQSAATPSAPSAVAGTPPASAAPLPPTAERAASESVATNASGSPAAAVVTAATPVAPAALAASLDAPVAKGPSTFWKWRVRRGDTIGRLCRITYGQCDQEAIRSIYQFNPGLGSSHSLRVGQVIIMPERSAENASD